MASNKLSVLKQQLDDLFVQRNKLVERDQELASLETNIAETSATVAELESDEGAKVQAAAVTRLRKQETTALADLVEAVTGLDTALAQATIVQRELTSVQPGAANTLAVHASLPTAIRAQMERWQRHTPELIGAAPLPTKGHERVTEAKLQLENAEQSKEKFNRYLRENPQMRATGEQSRRQEDLTAAIQHAQMVLRWAEKHRTERMPSEPRPTFPYPDGRLVTIHHDLP